MKKAPAPFTKYRFCCAQRGEPPGDGRIAGGCGIPSGVVERADRKKEGDGKMKRRDADLLDRMAQEIGCLYLSDLRWPDGAGRKKLADLVQRLTPDEASLREWNDALAYLTDAPQQPTAEQARAACGEIHLLARAGVTGEAALTMVNGQVVFQDGHFPGVDERALAREGEAVCTKVLREPCEAFHHLL